VYFVERETMGIKPVHITDGNANGVAISPDGKILYVPDTGVSKYYPTEKTPYGKRALAAFDISQSGAVLSNERLLSSPVSYFYDGVRVSRNGWIFCGAGDGVDVIDPESGFTLGTIRVGGGENLAVSLSFGRNELWIVGRGGVWHVKGVRERLDRDW
jgi:gluconolactonase